MSANEVVSLCTEQTSKTQCGSPVPATIHSTSCLTTVRDVPVTTTERDVPVTIHSTRCSGNNLQYEMFRWQSTGRDVLVTIHSTWCSGDNHRTTCSGDIHGTRWSDDSPQYEMFRWQSTVQDVPVTTTDRDVPVTTHSTRCSGDNTPPNYFTVRLLLSCLWSRNWVQPKPERTEQKAINLDELERTSCRVTAVKVLCYCDS